MICLFPILAREYILLLLLYLAFTFYLYLGSLQHVDIKQLTNSKVY